MGNRNDEMERLKRLRDRQLQARDPQQKQRQLQHGISKRYKKSREPFSFTKIWQEVEHKWRGILIGGFLGFIVLVILPNFLDSGWAEVVGVGAIFFLMLIGFGIGQAADSRDELRDLIHKR